MADDLVIIFAYHYPPENAIGAARPYRFAKYLGRMGYRCHVITAADVSSRPDLDAENVPDPFVSRPRSGFGWHTERAIRKLILPGVTGSQWALHAYRAAVRFMAANRGARTTVLSTYPPLGTHFAGYWFSRNQRVPWVADFRDPVADNPGNVEPTRLTRQTYRKLEEIFVSQAAYVIANTDSAADRLKKRYPKKAQNVELIWNGFDPEDRLLPLPRPSREAPVLAHVGELYGGRDVSPVLRSVERLIAKGLLSPRGIKILLVGDVAAGSVPDSVFIESAVRQGWLELRSERVGQREAHGIIQSADWLLLIQPQSALQVPGKLFEYLQIGRPVLAFVPRNSPVERLLENSGIWYSCVYPDATEQEFDKEILKFLSAPAADGTANSWFESEFNARNHARKLAMLIESLHLGRAGNEHPRSQALEP